MRIGARFQLVAAWGASALAVLSREFSNIYLKAILGTRGGPEPLHEERSRGRMLRV